MPPVFAELLLVFLRIDIVVNFTLSFDSLGGFEGPLPELPKPTPGMSVSFVPANPYF